MSGGWFIPSLDKEQFEWGGRKTQSQLWVGWLVHHRIYSISANLNPHRLRFSRPTLICDRTDSQPATVGVGGTDWGMNKKLNGMDHHHQHQFAQEQASRRRRSILFGRVLELKWVG